MDRWRLTTVADYYVKKSIRNQVKVEYEDWILPSEHVLLIPLPHQYRGLVVSMDCETIPLDEDSIRAGDILPV